MAEPVHVIGSYLSPYVRKVLVCLDLKGIAYTIDPIIPFFGNDHFTELSPLRRIPVLQDHQVTLCDSSVICQYLEDRYPNPAIFPADHAQSAQARWWEEFADTRMGDVFIWQLFNQLAIGPFVWGKQPDQTVLDKILNVELPHVMDHLERHMPHQDWLFGALSLADISIAAFFRNAAFARWKPDANRWPNTAALVERTLALEPFARLIPFEEKMARTPIPQQREALKAMGAPISETTVGTDKPVRGPLTQ